MNEHPPAPVLIMAGGTGGHIFPGLAVAEQLRAEGVPVVWLGAVGGMETHVVPAHGIPLQVITVNGLRGKGWKTRLYAPLMLASALWRALRVVQRCQPGSVLAMGGYVAGPGGIAAWLLRRPLLVHEQNSVAGYTSGWLARLARRVLTGFADTLPRGEWVGNPVRATIAALPAPAQRFAGRHGAARLLVLGGSLGARSINLTVPKILAQLPTAQRPEIWHQSGRRGVDEARDAYTRAGVQAQIVPFIEDMAASYAWADFVICRAGALTLAELTAAGLGAWLIPFPFAVDDHQTHNARALAAAGAAELIQESELDIEKSAQRLLALLSDRARLLAMAEAARRIAKPEAATVIAHACREVQT